MLKLHSTKEHCNCDYEVEYGRDWSDFDPGRQCDACPLFHDEGLGCTYMRWVDPEGTEWQKEVIIKLHKENEELKNEIHNMRREVIDKARWSDRLRGY